MASLPDAGTVAEGQPSDIRLPAPEPLEDQVLSDQETIGGTAELVQSMLGSGELSPESAARILSSLRASGLEIDATVPAEAAPPSPADVKLGDIQDQACRYFRAIYGPDYVYRAPETFGNLVERWIWAVGGDVAQMAEALMADIERLAAERRGDAGDRKSTRLNSS